LRRAPELIGRVGLLLGPTLPTVLRANDAIFGRWMGFDHFVAGNGSERNVLTDGETALAVYVVLTVPYVLGKIYMVPTEADRGQEPSPVKCVFPNPLSPPRLLKTPSQEAAVPLTSGTGHCKTHTTKPRILNHA
jgi:hypothetical protein